MYKQKFVSSKFKLWLFVILLSVFCIGIVIFALLMFKEKNNGYAFLISCYVLLIGIVLFLFGKMVYFVEVFDDKLVFQNVFKKQYVLIFLDIVDIQKIHLHREGDVFLIETKEKKNLLAYDYPFRFDYSPITADLVDFIKKVGIFEIPK